MRIFHLLFLATILAVISACGNLPEPPKPRFFIVLVDETGSFLDHGYWDRSLEVISRNVVGALGPGDQFVLIGIDDAGFQSDDVHIGIEVLDLSTLPAEMQKKDISRRVLEVTPRKHARARTDILGALQHAAYFFQAQQGEFRPVLLVFSDMIQTPRTPTSADALASDYRFPENTFGRMLFVNATGGSDFNRLRESWNPVLQALGLQSTNNDFFQEAQTVQGLAGLPS